MTLLLPVAPCLAFLVGALALAVTPAQTPNANSSPTGIVQQYLTARATHEYERAYALFSPQDRKQIPFAQFAEEKRFPADPTSDGVSPLLAAVSMLFMDSHNAYGYQFTVLGPDPADPHVVRVQARPPNTPLKDSFVLKIATVPDADEGGAPRIAMIPSYEKTSPSDFVTMREKAQAMTSLSNLRQIGLAVMQYAQDHGERFPDADRWVDQIAPYLGDKKASPAERDRQIESLFWDPSAPEGQKWNYAFNRNLSGVLLTSVKNQAETVLVFESTQATKNASDTGQSLPHPGRHSGGDYYAYADGRAKWAADAHRPSFAP